MDIKERKKLINYVMEKANKCYMDDFPIADIEDWINEFFYKQEQPQDKSKWITKKLSEERKVE